jgi:nucleoside recognition membrane protein YjiH
MTLAKKIISGNRIIFTLVLIVLLISCMVIAFGWSAARNVWNNICVESGMLIVDEEGEVSETCFNIDGTEIPRPEN